MKADRGKKAIKSRIWNKKERNRRKTALCIGNDKNGKNCETCADNDYGLCDRFGMWVKENDTCVKWRADWRDVMLRKFLRTQ